MRLCMFHPTERPMERGWVGRVDGDRVVHLAAQTLQHFFTGGAGAREHAEYARADVTLVSPVLHPPAVRVFEREDRFAFANPAAVAGPGAAVCAPVPELAALPRLAGIVGADGSFGGFTALLELRAPALPEPKDRDFGLVLGPLVVTPDELLGARLDAVLRVDGREALVGSFAGFDWERARAHASAHTCLRTGDVVAGPALGEAPGVRVGGTLELAVEPVGTLAASIVA